MFDMRLGKQRSEIPRAVVLAIVDDGTLVGWLQHANPEGHSVPRWRSIRGSIVDKLACRASRCQLAESGRGVSARRFGLRLDRSARTFVSCGRSCVSPGGYPCWTSIVARRLE